MEDNIYIALRNMCDVNGLPFTFTKDKEYPFVGKKTHRDSQNYCYVFICDQGVEFYITDSYIKYFVKKSELLSDETISNLLEESLEKELVLK